MDVNKLIRMANQIAANFEYGDKSKAAASTADHLRRFWTPDMRAQIVDYRGQDGTALTEVAALAVQKLAQETARPA